MIELNPESFGFLIDFNSRDGKPTIGLQIDTGTDSYVVPMDAGTAQDVGSTLLAHVCALASALKAVSR